MIRWTLLLFVLIGMVPASAEPPITAISIAPDQKAIILGSQSGIAIRSYPELNELRTFSTELANINSIAFSPDGKSLAVAGGRPGKRGRVELFDWPRGEMIRSVELPRDSVIQVRWRSDSQALLLAGSSAKVNLVDAGSMRILQSFEGHSKTALTAIFLPGDQQFLSGGIDESVRLWSLHDATPVRSFANHTRPVTDLLVMKSDEGAPANLIRAVSISEDRTVRLWQPLIGRMIRFARLDTIPMALTWCSKRKELVVACKNGGILWIDHETMMITREHAGIDGIPYCLAVASDGAVVVAGQNGTVRRIVRTD